MYDRRTVLHRVTICFSSLYVVMLLSPSLTHSKPFTGALLERFKMCDKLSAKECSENENCLMYDDGYIPVRTRAGSRATSAAQRSRACKGSVLEPIDIQQIKEECQRVNGLFFKGESYQCLCTFPNSNQQYRCLEDFIKQLIDKRDRMIE